MKQVFIPVLLVFLSLFSFAQSEHCLSDRYSQDALFDSTDIQITTDVHYATSMRWPGTQMDSLRMDIYQPNPVTDPLEKRPLIVMTHGGSFAAGNRTAMAYECMEMARRGFVTATISYRLGWNCSFSSDPCIVCQAEAWRAKVATYRAVQDNRAAIRHLVQNANELGIDTAFIFLQGESAGAITSLNSAFWNQAEADAWCSNCVDNVGELDTAGNDLTNTYSIKGVVNHCGAVSHADVLDGHQIPVINFHNNPDCVVPYGGGQVMNCLGCAAFYWVSGSNAIRTRLAENGVCTQRHARSQVLPDHCTYYTAPLLSKTSCFLKGILCDNCATELTDNDFSVPDCTSGSVVGINEIHDDNWIELHDSQLISTGSARLSKISIYDISMRLIADIRVAGSDTRIQLPETFQGCMVVKVDTEDRRSEVLKWCNF